MAVKTNIVIQCEICPTETDKYSSPTIARFWAKQSGWITQADGDLDLCPAHADLVEDLNVS